MKKTKKKSRATPEVEASTRKTNVASTKQAKSVRGRIERKTSSPTVRTSKKVSKQRKGRAKDTDRTRVTPTTPDRCDPRTPERKSRSATAQSTPSTAASSTSGSSKRAASMMEDLVLDSPLKKSKITLDEHSTVNFNDAFEFDWLNMSDVNNALIHHGEKLSDLKKLDYQDKIILLCSYYKPNDIRPVFQGICQDAGMNWRNLKLAKHKTMKTLAAEFAKACVDIYNAEIDLTVPANIAVKKETCDKGSKA